MKKWQLLLVLMVAIPSVSAVLNCTISNSTCSYTDVFHMSDLSNAHAEQSNESSYDYIVCCMETGGVNLSNACGEYIINISSSTNAHVELVNETSYAYSICLNSTTGYINITYQQVSCGQACLGTISGNSNAHIADCITDPYPTYICANYTSIETPTAAGTTGAVGQVGTSLVPIVRVEATEPTSESQPNQEFQLPFLGISIPNMGKLISGEKTSQIIGWMVILAAITLLITIINKKARKIDNKIDKRGRYDN